tara:strand:+ start:1527 stop:1964 length:438 start_codon:yes stop_codon:yes gene_type:complete
MMMSKIKLNKKQLDFIYDWSDSRVGIYHENLNWIFDDEETFPDITDLPYNNDTVSGEPRLWLPEDYVKDWYLQAIERWNSGLRTIPFKDGILPNKCYDGCPECKGEGEVEKQWCDTCDATGEVLKERDEVIKIFKSYLMEDDDAV